MASMSNAFSLLTSGQQDASINPKKRNKKKNKKKGAQGESQPVGVEVNVASPQQAPASVGQQVPTAGQLESMVKNASNAQEKTELMQTWSTDLAMQKAFIGRDGKPVSFRSALVDSRALEFCVEACVTIGVEGLEESVYRLLEEALKSTDPKVIQQMLLAVGKVANVVRKRGSEIETAGKRAVRDLVTALKQTDKFQSEQEHGNWNKSSKSRAKRSVVPERKPARGENKTDYDLTLALDEMKVRQSDLDEVREEHFGSNDALKSVTTGASKTISDLKFIMSMARRADDGFSDVPKKGKKGKGKGPSPVQAQPQVQAPKAGLMDPYNKEAQELQEQEISLQADITALETRLTSLKAQLAAIKDAQGQLQNRRGVLASSAAAASGIPLIPKDQQADVVGSLERVVSELEAMSTQTNDEDEAFVRMYVVAAEKVISSCLTKQDEVLKNVKFLKEALQRKKQAEEQLMGMVGSSRKELLNTNRKQRENLERQLYEARTVALGLSNKTDKVVLDAGVRSDILGKDTVARLEESARNVKAMHQEIIKESTIKKDPPPVVAPVVESGTPKKKFDASVIIKQAEMEAQQEMQMPRGRRGPNPQGPPRQQQPQHPTHQVAGPPVMSEQRVAPAPQVAQPVQPSHQPYTSPQPVRRQAAPSPGAVIGYEHSPPIAPPVTIPSVEDEMVPPPVADRNDGHFSPIGNGAHAGAQPVAPIAPQVASIAPPVQRQSPNPIMPIQPRQPYTAAAPRGWKKIDRSTPVDIGGGGGAAPTPAEAQDFPELGK